LDGRRSTGGLSGSGPSPNPRGPKPLADILGDLFAARGLARVQALGELEAAWADAVGEPGRRQTRVESLRRGVLSVTVAHPTLLEELASFQKPHLLASLRRAMGGTPIHDIRFRIGTVDQPDPPSPGRGKRESG
jgi:predicted nucleic acid-binding Zn ribbon protein